MLSLNFVLFRAGRPVYAPRQMVAASQPLAVAAGLELLDAGGNAADAAVAVAAVLAVVEPCSTGLGGDAFVLFHDAKAGANVRTEWFGPFASRSDSGGGPFQGLFSGDP